MNDVFVALMLSVGVGGWVYNKVDKRTGSNTQRSATAAGIAAVLAFLSMITMLRFVPS